MTMAVPLSLLLCTYLILFPLAWPPSVVNAQDANKELAEVLCLRCVLGVVGSCAHVRTHLITL